MLNQERLDAYKSLVEKANKSKADMQNMQTEIGLMKKQSLTTLKEEYGYTGFSDLPKMKEEILALEAAIEEEEVKMTEYIKYVAEKKEQKDNLMIG
jgi:hypothetical protein